MDITYPIKKSLLLFIINCILFRFFYQGLRANVEKLKKLYFVADFRIAAYHGYTSSTFESNLKINLSCTVMKYKMRKICKY